MNMCPGNLIYWALKSDKRIASIYVDGTNILHDEVVWSSIEGRHVLIGSNLVHLCIAYDGERITWINHKGLFNMHVNDCATRYGLPLEICTFPLSIYEKEVTRCLP
jgi:hypothetical protein